MNARVPTERLRHFAYFRFLLKSKQPARYNFFTEPPPGLSATETTADQRDG
jgi:hypothetical protein